MMKLAARNGWHEQGYVFPSHAGKMWYASSIVDQFKHVLSRHEMPTITFHTLRKAAGSLSGRRKM
ncbi:MAG TPA: hypothetical protein VKR06_06320 [Ktedonosporobacter sp.]|nr:hypothetical protein [Ktedonosporobacter sp.]